MGIHVRKPTVGDLSTLLERAAGDELTYAPPGISLASGEADGLVRREWSTALPAGSFATAARAVSTWEVQTRSGLAVLAEADVEPGIDVAMAAPLPVGYVDVTCRVVEVIDEPGRSGFAYGTLPVHPARGEESFVVTERDDGMVVFTVVAVSAPQHPLARLAGPIGDRLQRKAVNRYLTAMREIVRPA